MLGSAPSCRPAAAEGSMLLRESGLLQPWQLPICNSVFPTLRKTLKKFQLLCMSFPGASATSMAPEPNQAPQETAQGVPEYYTSISEGRISNLGFSYCREVLKQAPLCWCYEKQVWLVTPISGMLRRNNLHTARLGWLCWEESLKILLHPWPSDMCIRTPENTAFQPACRWTLWFSGAYQEGISKAMLMETLEWNIWLFTPFHM